MLWMKWLIDSIMMMKSLISVGIIIFIIFKVSTLKIAEDLELNPALYENVKSVQSSFNLSNMAMSHVTIGRQCACNVISFLKT